MSMQTSDKEGAELLKAIGIPIDNCKGAIIKIESGQAIIVEATYFASTGAGFKETLKTFKVKAVDETKTTNKEK